MRSGKRHVRLAAAVSAACLLALASCGGDGDDGVRPPDDEDLVAMLEPLFDSEVTGAARNLRLPDGPSGCLEITPMPWNDSDGDGVPDDATFTFDEEGCAFTFPGGGGTTGGTVHVVDPGAAFGYQAQLIGLFLSATGGDPPTTTTRTFNGSQTVTGAPAAVTMVRDLTIVTQMSGLPAATAAELLTIVYTPTAGQQVQFGVGTPLPTGSLTMTGSLTWSIPGRTVELAITTATPLAYNGGCDLGGPESGEIHVTVVSGADPGHLVVRYESCEPVIEWFPGS